MKTKVSKWGNSRAVRIPKSFALEAQMKEGTAVNLSLQDGKIVIELERAERFSLSSLLGEINGETSTRAPRRREAW